MIVPTWWASIQSPDQEAAWVYRLCARYLRLALMLGVSAAQLFYQTGAGFIGAGLVGVVAVVGVMARLFDPLRAPILRLIVALVFAAPTAIASDGLIHGVTKQAVPSEIWR